MKSLAPLILAAPLAVGTQRPGWLSNQPSTRSETLTMRLPGGSALTIGSPLRSASMRGVRRRDSAASGCGTAAASSPWQQRADEGSPDQVDPVAADLRTDMDAGGLHVAPVAESARNRPDEDLQENRRPSARSGSAQSAAWTLGAVTYAIRYDPAAGCSLYIIATAVRD